MDIIILIFILIGVSFAGIAFIALKHYRKKQKNALKAQLTQLSQQIKEAKTYLQKISQDAVLKEEEVAQIENKFINTKQELDIIQKFLEQKQEERDYLNNYIQEQQKFLNDIDKISENKEVDLISKYKRKEQELIQQFKETEKNVKNKHQELVQQYQLEIDSIKTELDSIQSTKRAAIEAARKERLTREQKNYYTLELSNLDKKDIELLKEIENQISKKRALRMLIWQSYYMPKAKEKFPIILGKSNVCGIYKITNLETDECYIGQSLDIKKRFYEHCKAMLSIDTPANNQLYQAAAHYGLSSFSFELLEECSPEELNEKEKYYIKLYQSDVVGYNISAGHN